MMKGLIDRFIAAHRDVDGENISLRRTQIKTRLRAYPEMLLAQPLVGLLLLGLLWDDIQHELALLWYGVLLAFIATDAVNFLLWRGKVNEPAELRRWFKAFSLMSAVSGVIWGVGAWVLFTPDSLTEQTLLIMVLNGVVAGAVTLNPTFLPSMYLFVLGLSLPLMVRVAMMADMVHAFIATMLLIYLIFILRAGNSLSATFQLALNRGWEREILLDALLKQKDQAEEANRAKSRFLAAASHDLRQPLQALTLFLDVLDGSVHEPGQVRLVRQINKSVASLGQMFTQLLDLSKLDAGIIKPEPRSFRLLGLMDGIQNDFGIVAEQKGLRLDVKVDDVSVYSDPSLLDRIVRNLVSNAIRYTDQGSVSVVACQQADGRVRLAVADTGVGIPAAEIDHIFDEYYQINNQHRDRNQGLGLGLAIVKRITLLLGVELSVDSREGGGTTFGLLLPGGERESRPADRHAQPHGADGGRGALIALIEDDADVLEATQHILRGWGFEVIGGQSADELLLGLTRAERNPALVISDYRLPNDENGLKAIERVQRHCGDPIPALVMTGDTGARELRDMSDSGVRVLHKPVQPEALKDTLYALLG